MKTDSTPLFTINIGENKPFVVTTKTATYVMLGIGAIALAKTNEEFLYIVTKSLSDYGVALVPSFSSLYLILQEAKDITRTVGKVVFAAIALPFLIKSIGLIAQFVSFIARAITATTEKISDWMLNGILNEENKVLLDYAIRCTLLYLLMLTVLIPARMHHVL